MKLFGKRIKLSSSQVIIFGFMGAILAGSLLLMLPISSAKGVWTPFVDAAFTATSATCVTGLIVFDTATYWSGFGQAVILLMIQIGGMGVVTVSVLIAMASGKKIGLMHRSTMQESVSAHQVGGILRYTQFILKGSLLVEGLGAIIMYPVFAKEFGWVKGIWYSIFHSMSAFCNAGFDLMGAKKPFSSLTSFVTHPVINVVIMLLIILGGLGFLTWNDVVTHKWHVKRYRLQSKVILATSAVLIILPALFFFFVEFAGKDWSGMSMGQRIWASLFQSVTTRTAGFNTVDFGAMSESGQFLTVFLMMIGGSPGSTAGGLKTTTLAVLFISAIGIFRRQEDAQCFGRRLEAVIVRNAAALLLMYLTIISVGSVIISQVEHIPLMTSAFECASAIGTVGLTTGITSKLGTFSHVLLMLMMYAGRVGGMTLVFATLPGDKRKNMKFPQEKITVG